MSYNTIATMADDALLLGRLTACAAEKKKERPYSVWVQTNRWDLVRTPGWLEAWETAAATGTENIGSNPDVITDGMILSAVEPSPEPPVDPPTDNVWTSGATLTTKTDGDGTLWQIGTRTTTAAVRLLSLITGLDLAPSTAYRFRATLREPKEFHLSNLAFRPDVNTSTNGVIIASPVTIPSGVSTLDFTFTTPATPMTANAGVAFVSSSGVVGDYLEVRDDATVEPTDQPTAASAPEPADDSANTEPAIA